MPGHSLNVITPARLRRERFNGRFTKCNATRAQNTQTTHAIITPLDTSALLLFLTFRNWAARDDTLNTQ